MEIQVRMKINSEKKHSIRYDAIGKEAGVQSIYVMRNSIPNPIPQNITITVKYGE